MYDEGAWKQGCFGFSRLPGSRQKLTDLSRGCQEVGVQR